MEYKIGSTTVEASRWFKNGDHPKDNSREITVDDRTFLTEGEVVRRYRNPDRPGEIDCDTCGHAFHLHGWIDVASGGISVCPGDYIITTQSGDIYPTDPATFEEAYNLKAGYGD